MLKLLCVPSVVTFLCSSVLKALRTVEGHLATNTTVLEYIQNKARITNQKDYLEYMQNPLIAQYEKISSATYFLSFAVADVQNNGQHDVYRHDAA